ncbi:NAD-dependent epimerase/dehydratase family protein [Streptomyces sp. NPDC059649]|uniref:NAD-dependent epimerase/dehydratase family protein n=1 Tax=Streptomyces sp. NPDC059649 TaxID=3346895 RepID=UPI0036BAA3BE
MQTIGNGFLAWHLSAAFADRFPQVTAIAAGVSSHSAVSPAAFDREAELLYDVLQQCRERHQTLLFFSSASFAMYGSTGAVCDEDGPLCPTTVYGRHKLALETAIRLSGVDFLILRLSHMVGLHQRAHQLLPGLTQQVLGGSVKVLEGAHRDMLDVRDLVDAIDRLLTAGVHHEVINLASGIPQPIDTVIDGIEKRLGVSAQRIHHPGPQAVTRASIHRLRTYVPQFRPALHSEGYLDEMLDRYLPYYADQFAPDRA